MQLCGPSACIRQRHVIAGIQARGGSLQSPGLPAPAISPGGNVHRRWVALGAGAVLPSEGEPGWRGWIRLHPMQEDSRNPTDVTEQSQCLWRNQRCDEQCSCHSDFGRNKCGAFPFHSEESY